MSISAGTANGSVSSSSARSYIRDDGIYWQSSPSPRALAVSRIEAALRARRAAYAAYGRALSHVDYTTPQAERDACYAVLRAAIQAADIDLAVALDDLEELL